MIDVTAATRRRLAAGGLALALAAGPVAGCSDDDTAGGGASPQGAASEAAAPEPPFAVGRRTLELVDTSRGTDAVPGRFPARPDRTVEVDVLYPAEGEAGDAAPPVWDGGGAAAPDPPPADGSFPLVVFAHGFGGRADSFLAFAERWAREGYVVALPTFPLSREGVAVSDDVVNQPGDVSFVIDELTALADDDPLAGRVDGDRVAVGGHSLGSATTYGVAYNSCCRDDRIDATITVAGGSLPYEGGDYEDAPDVPMLLVHGAADALVPIAIGDAMFDLAEHPVWYLRPTAGDHVTVFVGEPGRLFDEAATAFLDVQLRDADPAALDAVGDEVGAAGVGDWRVRADTP